MFYLTSYVMLFICDLSLAKLTFILFVYTIGAFILIVFSIKAAASGVYLFVCNMVCLFEAYIT